MGVAWQIIEMLTLAKMIEMRLWSKRQTSNFYIYFNVFVLFCARISGIKHCISNAYVFISKYMLCYVKKKIDIKKSVTI